MNLDEKQAAAKAAEGQARAVLERQQEVLELEELDRKQKRKAEADEAERQKRAAARARKEAAQEAARVAREAEAQRKARIEGLKPLLKRSKCLCSCGLPIHKLSYKIRGPDAQVKWWGWDLFVAAEDSR